MKLSKYIDHTLLKSIATKEDIIALCQEALAHDFQSVCINPFWVSTAAEALKETQVKVCTVIGFPLGSAATATKVFETKNAIENGAQEIDMVLNVGALKSGLFDQVENDVKAVVKAANQTLVKVIIETCYLTLEEKKIACEIAVKAGAQFVKTSTGFGSGGATVDDVRLMREVVGPSMGVKASGGVKTPDDFKAMIDAGATRIGTSNGVALVAGKSTDSDY